MGGYKHNARLDQVNNRFILHDNLKLCIISVLRMKCATDFKYLHLNDYLRTQAD